MLNELAPILAFMARSKDTQLNKDISYFLYKKQHESMGIQPNFEIDIDRYGQEIAGKLEKSIQHAVDESNKKFR